MTSHIHIHGSIHAHAFKCRQLTVKISLGPLSSVICPGSWYSCGVIRQPKHPYWASTPCMALTHSSDLGFPHVCLKSRNYWGTARGIRARALNLTSKCSTSKYNLAAWDVSGKLGVLLTWECKLCLKQCLGGFIGRGNKHMNNRSQDFLLEYCSAAIIIISYLFIYLFSAFETKLKSASLSTQTYKIFNFQLFYNLTFNYLISLVYLVSNIWLRVYPSVNLS